METKNIHHHDYAHDHMDAHNNHHSHHHDHGTEAHNACVSIVPIFNHLEKEQMDEIMEVTHSVTYKKGEVIYRAGDKSDSLYIVSEGKIRIYRLSESGKEQLIRILRPGDFTGELALFTGTIHEAYAEAMEETSACTVKRSDLQDLLVKYPSFHLRCWLNSRADWNSRKSRQQALQLKKWRQESHIIWQNALMIKAIRMSSCFL